MKAREMKGEFLKLNLLPEAFDDCAPHRFPAYEGQQEVDVGSVWQCGYCGRTWEYRKTWKKDGYFHVHRGKEWVPTSPPATKTQWKENTG